MTPLRSLILTLSLHALLAAAARNIIFTTSTPPIDAGAGLNRCIHYHGTYNDNTSVYSLQDDDDTCFNSLSLWIDSASIVSEAAFAPSPNHDGAVNAYEIVHVQDALLDNSAAVPKAKDDANQWLRSVQEHQLDLYARASAALSSAPSSPHDHPDPGTAQRVLTSQDSFEVTKDLDEQVRIASLVLSGRPQLLHASLSSASKTAPGSAFFSIPRQLLPVADLLFPDTSVLVSVPSYSLPAPSSFSSASASRSNDQEDPHYPSWLNDTISSLRYTPLVDAIISGALETDQLEKDVRRLTNEDGNASWRTRHSFTEGALKASEWIKSVMEKEGGADCEFMEYMEGFAPNVICQYKGHTEPSSHVILSAHYDSRGSFGHVRAPGGDDDASGVSALLSISRAIKAYNLKFGNSVTLAAFSGEEQGLWGSRAYSKALKDQGKKVKWMTQMDMLGYRAEDEAPQIAFPDKLSSPLARQLMGNLSHLYVPSLQVGLTPACCSDHQSFDSQGFTSTWVFERNGPIADPKYHNSQDLSDREGYDFEQIQSIGRVVLATLLEVAGFDI